MFLAQEVNVFFFLYMPSLYMFLSSGNDELNIYIPFVCSLQNNALLARRLLNGELKPSKMLNMTPIELKVPYLSKFIFLKKYFMELLTCLIDEVNLFNRFPPTVYQFNLAASGLGFCH
jgi:hypothetical protein